MDALFIHMHVWVLASVMVGVLGAGVFTIRILSLNKPLDAVVVVEVVFEAVCALMCGVRERDCGWVGFR